MLKTPYKSKPATVSIGNFVHIVLDEVLKFMFSEHDVYTHIRIAG